MSYLPCKNPNCKSYGTPHPNCKCYDGYAKGGDVEPYCATERAHMKDCQYFQGGGEVEDFDPDAYLAEKGIKVEAPKEEEFDPDAYLAEKAAQKPAAAPPEEEQTADVPEMFDPDAYLKDKKEEWYGKPSDVGLTAVEGATRGLIPGAPWLEAHNPLILIPEGQKMASEENQKNRSETNPSTSRLSELGSVLGSFATGVGAPAAISQGVEAIAARLFPEAAKAATTELVPLAAAGATKAARYAKLAPDLVKGFLTNGLIQGNDEISKAMLGQGDPEAPVGAALFNMGAAGLFGAALGAGTGYADYKLLKPAATAVANAKLGDRITGFMIGLSHAAQETDPETRVPLGDYGPYKAGQKLMDKLLNPYSTAGAGTGALIGANEGYEKNGVLGMPWGAFKGGVEGYVLGLAGKFGKDAAAKGSRKFIVPALLNIMSKGFVQDTLNALNHAEEVGAGADWIHDSIDHVFRGTSQQAVDTFSDHDKREKLKDFIAKGGILQNIQQQIYEDAAAPPKFAEGGEVKSPQGVGTTPGVIPEAHDSVATVFPDQNLLLQAAKGRVSNYLQSQQPQKHAPKLPFDDEPDTREAEKSYNRALDIALKPASVLGHIQKGTLEPDHMKHMNAMYPEVVSQLQKKVTAKIAEAQVKGEKPSYKVRQGLSMLMGTPLSGEMTPANIQAAQATFQPSQPQPAAAPPPKKKGTSALSKSDQAFMTSDQSRQKRLQKV